MSDKPSVLHGLKILLIDDERLTLKLISAILRRLGAEVETHSNAALVLDKVDLSTFDLLISDMHMPIKDGHSLIREIRRMPAERGGKIPAIAITAYARHDVLARAIAEGYNAYMTKPVDPPELVKLAERIFTNQGPKAQDPVG
jgi:CheY-like chemotaxis protein